MSAAFYGGDGRPLSREEEQARTAYTAVDALYSVRWGAIHHDIDLVDEAHTVIANLRADCTRRSVGW
ncbi:hypothetical protein [Streptomyces gossypiisoli]|uniref:hypothetical protein n=1 Tax=Streptomyces gossypiisoli TaxID=2748864 RepID=UPI0015DAF1FA|nr:hypothetical protein [Streptomyces gossypiisoli]